MPQLSFLIYWRGQQDLGRYEAYRSFYIGFSYFYFPKWQHTRAGASAKTKLASTHQDYYGCVISHYADVCTKNILKILGPEGPEERMHNQLHMQTCCTHIVLHAATDPLRLHTQTETGAKVTETLQFKWGFCARCCCMLLLPLCFHSIPYIHLLCTFSVQRKQGNSPSKAHWQHLFEDLYLSFTQKDIQVFLRPPIP